MARQARQRSETDIYHVMMRGNNKEYIFASAEAKAYFLEVLFKVEAEERLDVVAWCLMDNHVHLLVKVPFEDFERVLKRLNVSFAFYYHKVNKTVGHVFQDRFKSVPVEGDESVVNNVRYIHNNPVEAKMVDRAMAYKWSSYNTFIAEPRNETMVMVKSLIGASTRRFNKFHSIEDGGIYLDIKEVQEALKEKAAQKAIVRVCKKHGVIDYKEIQGNKRILQEIVKEVASDSHLSGRKIAHLLGLSEGTVRRIREK